jgi:hypothetical protein
MRSVKHVMVGAALIASLASVSSASAANWDPQGVARTATAGTTSLTTSNGFTVSCTQADATLTASGHVASGPAPTFGGVCSGPLSGPVVTTFGTWHFTAVSTTSVTATATAGPNGAVAQIHFSSGCTITVPGDVTITGNTWNNATHQLTVNTNASFPITSNAACFGLPGSSGSMHATFQLPSDVIIT